MTVNARASDLCLTEEGYRIADGTRATIGGILEKITIKNTRNRKSMAFLTLEDPTGTTEVLMFPGAYEKYSDILEEGECISFREPLNWKTVKMRSSLLKA